jgi:polyferredoxin
MILGWRRYSFILTIAFFVLGFFNILFAWLGFLCLLFPFVLLMKNKRKTWCQDYCPRANLFGVLFRNRSLTGKAGPKWLIRGEVKGYVLIYFFSNIFLLIMSTLMVLIGRMEPINIIRFLIAFKLPWEIPQFLNFGSFPDWTIHLSFRIYSIMFTTTVLGLLLDWIFRPRTWCTVCPINTISDLVLRKSEKQG